MSASTSATDQSALRTQIAQGFALLRQGRHADAIALSESLLSAHGANAELLYLACEARAMGGDLEQALERIGLAIAAAPGQLPLLLRQAQLLLSLRRRSSFREVAEAAIVLAGAHGPSLWEIGRLFAAGDDPTAAADLFERARAAGCVDPRLHYELATAQFFLGDFDAAQANLESALALAPQMGQALYLRSTLHRQTQASNHVADLQARLASGISEPMARAECQFALAKELEDLGRYEESFANLTQAAALKRQSLDYDAVTELASIDAIGATYGSQALSAIADGHDQPGAIFIVGMPRTGTTLVERMLGRHHAVRSAGELLDFSQLLAAAARNQQALHPDQSMVEASLHIDFADLGRHYIAGAREAAGGSAWFIDKMPVNFIYCGLILKALPKARIIHVTRNPMDTCYAVYKTSFHRAYHFSYDLDELADYYLAYHRLMRHWHAVLPGAILDVRYEDLVADFEGQARRIVAWCGLDWQPAVLAPDSNALPSTTASAAQVREPVHARSVQNWRNHERGLALLKTRLENAGIADAGAA